MQFCNLIAKLHKIFEWEKYSSIVLSLYHYPTGRSITNLHEIGTRDGHIEQHLLCRLASGGQQPPHHVVEKHGIPLSTLHHYLPVSLVELFLEGYNN